MPAMVISGTSLSGAGGCGTMSRMRAELTRFRVLPGHSAVVEEWMAFLRRHEAAVRETLPAEKMHVESVFTETVDGVQYLYWYSVQGEGGASWRTRPTGWTACTWTIGTGASTPTTRRRT